MIFIWIIIKKLILLLSSHETTPMSTRVMTTWSLKIFLELQNGTKTKNSAIYHFHIDHNANCFPPKPPFPSPSPHQKKSITIVLLSSSLGTTVIPRKNCKQRSCKIWGGGGGEGMSLGHWYSQYEVTFGWMNLWKNCAKIMVKGILPVRYTVNIFCAKLNLLRVYE